MTPERAKVDLAKKSAQIGKTRYFYELRNDRRIWYRFSKTWAYADEGKFLIKELEEAESRGEGPNNDWEPLERHVKDSHKLKQLNNIVDRALERRMRKRRHKLKHQYKDVQSQKEVEPEDDRPPQNDTHQKRTKWGIRIYSSDGKHFFNLGCWKSTKYPGKASIRLISK